MSDLFYSGHKSRIWSYNDKKTHREKGLDGAVTLSIFAISCQFVLRCERASWKGFKVDHYGRFSPQESLNVQNEISMIDLGCADG